MKILTDKQLESLLWKAEQKGYANGCEKGYRFGYEEGHNAGVMCKQSNNKEEPLLSITLSDINAVPVVHYKGEQIGRRVRVSFDWSANEISQTYIHIEHMEPEEKLINTKIIQHNHPIVEERVEIMCMGKE